MEIPECRITKAKLSNEQLTVEYTEVFKEANYQNDVVKSCKQIVHNDLKVSFAMLKPHVAAICEMPEAKEVNVLEPTEADMGTLEAYIVTGYSKGGTDEHAGVTIIAQKLLKIGKALNLTVPFVQFEDESSNAYAYAEKLKSIVDRCDYEVDAYLFDEKWGIKQQDLFADDPFMEATVEEPKKRGRKTTINIPVEC